MAHRRQSKRKRVIKETLTEGIIFEILLRLPVRSLLRCKSVCKLWYSLISDQHFINSHVRLSTIKSHMDRSPLTRNKLIISINEPKTFGSHYPVLFQQIFARLSSPLVAYVAPRTQIVGSCNGLLCIVEHNTLIIYNPSTRILNKLPSSGLINQEGYDLKYAFGYDESTDDYKVVGLSFYPKLLTYSDTAHKVKIYSLKTGKWKIINDFPDVLPSIKHGKFLNGALHWGLRNKNVRSSWTIVSLDLAKETCGEILQPVYEGYSTLTLGVLGEWLCAMYVYRERPVDVWVMKDYGVKDSWTRLFSIPHGFGLFRTIYLAPLCISNDGKVLLQFHDKLVVYDSMSDSFTDIHNFKAFYQACTIVESLVSPHAPLKRKMSRSRKRGNVKHS